jgi:two-component system phosphate regulon sensor histidine kinase PhoR
LPVDLEILASKSKIEQVFTNLIHNAVKYNRDDGFVRIYSEQFKDKIKITVEDSGSGIPVKDASRIYERFYRVDRSRSRDTGGTGLGMAIVKHVISRHHGELKIESTLGVGSEFSLSFPHQRIA